ncbi:DUF4365 domain-containing protein [Shewanella rhizosphaerae]|uniref:DUF4365 domain-containing protein n=1 Tax=Shewanella rhizosphaerae TaxID=2864207 RepID=UPI001C65913E|nr:DUF4365 domain-containing protein [Shewanella rhizosphaerae]QYK12284.1 DUF4365 domain-containing protein [Shewanella rhizosphaerae]
MATGSIAPNFHEGARSEYLAQYVLTSFGTASLVPRPEDYGVDFFCSLGRRIGQRLHIDNYFSVQVKSSTDDVIYDGKKSVEWLTSLNSPLLFCCVNKKKSIVSIYAALGICMLSAKTSLEFVRLVFEPFPKDYEVVQGSPKPCAEHKNNLQAEVYLGKPILEFNVERLSDENFLTNAKLILKKWINIDQENLDHRSMGYTFYHMPGDHEPNEMPSEETHIVGNFLDALADRKNTHKHYQTLYKSLSQQINWATNQYDIEMFKILHETTLHILKREPDTKGNGGVALISSLLSGGKHLNVEIAPYFREVFGEFEI